MRAQCFVSEMTSVSNMHNLERTPMSNVHNVLYGRLQVCTMFCFRDDIIVSCVHNLLF